MINNCVVRVWHVEGSRRHQWRGPWDLISDLQWKGQGWGSCGLHLAPLKHNHSRFGTATSSCRAGRSHSPQKCKSIRNSFCDVLHCFSEFLHNVTVDAPCSEFLMSSEFKALIAATPRDLLFFGIQITKTSDKNRRSIIYSIAIINNIRNHSLRCRKHNSTLLSP